MQNEIYRTRSSSQLAAFSKKKKSFASIRTVLLFLFVGVFSSNVLLAQGWSQKGADINGVANEGLGVSLSMSADGNTIAIGNNDDDVSANAVRSSVKVKKWNGTSWEQKGSTLYATQSGDNFGSRLSLSADGNVLAIGAYANNSTYGEFMDAGTVYVYAWSGSDWVMRGSVFNASESREHFGESISISEDGSVLAVGAPSADAGGSLKGAAQVFKWSGSSWAQLGSRLIGGVNYENLGTSVSVKETATEIVLAIGGSTYTSSGLDYRGLVKIYRYSAGSWSAPVVKEGDAAGDYFGNSVSLSSDAKRLAIGAPTDLGIYSAAYIGYARVFDFAAGTWTAAGSDIISPVAGDEFGSRIMISGDGASVIIGAKNPVTGSANGRAEVYAFSAGSWQKVGSSLTGETDSDLFAVSVAINSDGKRMAVGASNNGGGGISSGEVKVYSLACVPPAAPAGTATQTFCSGATVAQLTATGTALNWYTAATAGTLLASTTALVNGTTYYASQTVSECESTSRLAVTVTLNTTAVPTGSSTQTFCNAATIASLTATGTDIKWYDAATGGTLLSSTTALANNTKYYASQTLNTCESTSRLEVTVTINSTAAPTGSALQVVCVAGTVANLVATGTDIKWYDAGTGGNLLTSTTSLVNGNNYYVSQTLNGCESTSRLKVGLAVLVYAAPTGAQTQSFCDAATVANLVATPQDNNTIKWYAVASGGTSLASTTALVNNTTYYATQGAGTCESPTRLAVTVSLLPLPTLPSVSVTQPTCTLATGTITVTTQQSGETYSFNNGTDYQAANAKASVAAGSYQVIIKATNGCASSAAAAVVNAQPATPAIPVVTVTQPTCATPTGTVTVTKQNAGETYSFNNGTNFQTDNSKAGLAAGNYQVIIKSAEGCTSVAANATINAPLAVPAVPTGNATQIFCNSATVAQLTATGTSIKWYAAATGGTALATTTALENDATYFASQTVTCESTSRLAVKATIVKPAAPAGDAKQVFCKQSTVADLSATASQAVSWYTTATGGTALANTTVLTTGTYYAGYTTTQGGCESPRLAVAVDYAYFWKTMATGLTHALGIQLNGTLWAWGSNSNGQLAISTSTTPQQSKPVQVGSDLWTVVAAGYGFSVGIKQDGTLWTWGKNDLGQLGNGTQIDKNAPSQIGTDKWISVSATYDHVLALRQDGTLWTWGGNGWGQLSSAGGGKGTGAFKNQPLQIGTDKWVFISAGWGTGAGIRQDGTLWTWGDNMFGQLGRGPVLESGEGDAVVTQVGTDKWKTIDMGINSSIGIKQNNTLWVSGLGGLDGFKSTHVQIGTDSWLSASTSARAGAGVKQDGTLWTWGDNSLGQLGDGTATSTAAPAKVGTSNKWVSVASRSLYFFSSPSASSEIVLGLQQDGTLWSWGTSLTGELGTGNTSSNTPAIFGGVPPVIAKPTLTLSGVSTPVLTASSGTGYLWYKNGTVITGATGSTYTPPGTGPEGKYAVATIDSKGCSSPLSNEVVIYITGLEEAARTTVQFYPNPASESLLVQGIEEQAQVTVFSMTGIEQRINSDWVAGEKARRVNVSELTSGIYLLHVQHGNKSAAVKFIKQ